jgi:hypothetical protein
MPKKITLIFMFSILVSGTSVAEEEKKDGDKCALVHDIAKTIMIARQDEDSIAKMMGRFSEDDKFTRLFILEAYKTQKFDDDKLKVKAVDEFANRLALECYSTTIGLQ